MSEELDDGSSSATIATSGTKGEDTLETSIAMSSDGGENFAEGKKVFGPSPNIALQVLGFKGCKGISVTDSSSELCCSNGKSAAVASRVWTGARGSGTSRVVPGDEAARDGNAAHFPAASRQEHAFRYRPHQHGAGLCIFDKDQRLTYEVEIGRNGKKSAANLASA